MTAPENRNPSQQGFDESYGIPRTSNEAQTTIAQGQTAANTSFIWEGRAGSPPRNVKPFDLETRRTIDRESAEKGVAFMERSVRDRKPFFLYYPMTQIHFPTLTHPDFVGKTGAGDIADAMAEVDDNVGRMLDAVDRLGISRTTIVFWCTDNGAEGRRPWRGSSGPWSGFYNSVMEGGIRTPCLVRWPGRIPAGRVTNELVHEIDFFPTIAAAVGADIVPHDRAIDGVNQLPFFEGKEAMSRRESVLLYANAQLRAVKWHDWKLHYVYAPGGRRPAGRAVDAALQSAVRSQRGDRHQGREPVAAERHGPNPERVQRHDPALSARAAQRAGSLSATQDVGRVAVERREFIAMLASTPAVSISSAADAQAATPAAAPKPLSITLLGTGTPSPSLDRQSSGYLIEVGHDVIVWDHGPGAHHRLLQSGHRSVDVTHAFFTHLHYDHCMDYGRLVLQRWDQGADRIADLNVYGPPPIARMTEQLFGIDGIYGPDIRARIEHKSSQDQFEARGGTLPRRRPAPKVTEIHAGSVISGDGWKVTVGHAQHVQPYLECLAFRIDTSEGSICYTGDSGPHDAIVELAKGCDILIHMNHYFSGTEPSPAYRMACGNHRDNAVIAKRAGVKTLVLTHLLGQIDRPSVREQIVHEIQKVFEGKVIWGEDLMRLTPADARLSAIESRQG